MAVKEQMIIGLALVGVCILISVLIKFRYQSLFRFGIVLLPFILLGTLIFNMLRFPAIDQGDRWQLLRLPSNELIDLYDSSITPFKTRWIYPLVDIYYQGRTIYIPDSLLGTLDLSQELLESQGHLEDVVSLQIENELTESEVEMILELEYDKIVMKDGTVYHFVTEGLDLNSSLLLLKHGNHVFFIPQDNLSAWESSP